MENNNVIEGTIVPTSQMNLAGVLRIPAVRQVVLLIGVAAAVAAGFATETVRAPAEWHAQVEAQGHGQSVLEALTRDAQGTEFLLMGLRLTQGIVADDYERVAGVSLSEQTLSQLEAQGLVERDGERVRATGQGRLVLDAVIEALVP